MYKLELSPLYVKAKEVIIKMIRNGEFPENRLPSEDELAARLGVSRATIREALMALTREGIVTKKQGIGNFVHPSALESGMRVDLIADFADLLRSSGHTVEVKHTGFHREPITERIAKKLALSGSENLYVFTRTYFADAEAAISATIRIPEIYVQRDISGAEADQTMVAVLRRCCDAEISHSILWFQPTVASADLAALFGLEPGQPVVSWEELFYDLYDHGVCFNSIAFNPRIVGLSMLRKWN